MANHIDFTISHFGMIRTRSRLHFSTFPRKEPIHIFHFFHIIGFIHEAALCELTGTMRQTSAWLAEAARRCSCTPQQPRLRDLRCQWLSGHDGHCAAPQVRILEVHAAFMISALIQNSVLCCLVCLHQYA